jgi:hypothetical protein
MNMFLTVVLVAALLTATPGEASRLLTGGREKQQELRSMLLIIVATSISNREKQVL